LNRSRALVTTRSAVSAFCVAIIAASLLAACGGSLPAAQPEAKQATDMGGVTSASAVAPVAAIRPPTTADTVPRDYAGIRNVVAYHDGYYSGSMPDGAEAFETLHAMGIKTIISVDGAAPDVEAAKRLGMRYIHLPIATTPLISSAASSSRAPRAMRWPRVPSISTATASNYRD